MIRKITQNKLLVAALLVASSGISLVATKHAYKASVPAKVGFVRMEQIMGQDLAKSADEWRESVTELEKELEKRASEIKSEEQKLRKEFAEFQGKTGKFMSDDSRDKKREELAQMEKNIEIKYQSLKGYAARTEQKVQMEMAQKIKDAVDQLAKMQGWDAIMPAYFYASDRVDVTADVLAILNDTYAKSKAPKAVAPATPAPAKPAAAPAKKA